MKKELWLIIILVLGLFLRFYNLGQKSLWTDEFGSLDRAEKPFSEIIRTPELSPPLYYFILHLMVEKWGKDEKILRLTSALAGALTIYIIYLLGKTWFNIKTGLLSALILSISSFHIQISQEARMYSLVILFWGLMLLFFIKAVLTQKKRCWLGWYFSALAALYTSHISIFLIIGQFFALAFIDKEKRKNNFAAFSRSIIAIIPLYIPCLILIINQYTWGIGFSYSPRLSLDMLVRLAGIPFHFLAGYLYANPADIGVKAILTNPFGTIFVLLVMTLSLAIFLLSWSFNRAPHTNRIGVGVKSLWWIFISPILGIYLIMPGRVAARQIGVSVLPLFINLAIVIQQGFSKKALARVLAISLLLINLAVLIDYYGRDDNPFAKADWRRASSFVNENFHPQKDIIFSVFDYYLSDTAKKKRIGTIVSIDKKKVIETLNSGGRVWFILYPRHGHDKEKMEQVKRLKGNRPLLEKGPFGENLKVYILDCS